MLVLDPLVVYGRSVADIIDEMRLSPAATVTTLLVEDTVLCHGLDTNVVMTLSGE